jgi:hypothetical protein
VRSFSRRLVPFHSHDVLTRPHAHTRADDPVAPLHVMARPLQPRYGRPRSGGARSTGRTRTWGLRSRRCPCPYAVPLRRMQWQSAVVIRKPRAVSPSDPSGRPITPLRTPPGSRVKARGRRHRHVNQSGQIRATCRPASGTCDVEREDLGFLPLFFSPPRCPKSESAK